METAVHSRCYGFPQTRRKFAGNKGRQHVGEQVPLRFHLAEGKTPHVVEHNAGSLSGVRRNYARAYRMDAGPNPFGHNGRHENNLYSDERTEIAWI